MNELISIIVPAYNADKYIRETIRSLSNQTYSNIEIICVDDGSSDNTYQSLRRIAAEDERVRVFSKTNEGVTKARQFGVEKARGEYVGFVDADDVIEPTMFERLYINSKKYHADISHCAHDVVWLDGRKESFYGTGRITQQDRTAGLLSLISGSFEPGLWNKLYKRSLLDTLFRSGVMDCSIKINEDLLMNYYLFKEAGSSVLEDVCLYHYIKHEGSASSSSCNNNHIWDPIKVKQIIADDSIGTAYEKDAQKAYLLTCINQYNNLLKQKSSRFEEEKKAVRALILAQKGNIKLLKRKHALGAALLCKFPAVYDLLYQLIR